MSFLNILEAFGPGAAGLAVLGLVLWASRGARAAVSQQMRFPAGFVWVLGICAVLLLGIAGAGIYFDDPAMSALFGACGVASLIAAWAFAGVRHELTAAGFVHRPAFGPVREIPWETITQVDFLTGRNAWALHMGAARLLVGGMLTGQGGFAAALRANLAPDVITEQARNKLNAQTKR
ncbi:MAG: hypothetical protein AAGD12_01970 [Pseudomonadota bacterium]